MNLTLHIIRKDLRALRWGMLLWIAACLTHLGLRLAQLARGDTATLTPFWRGLGTSTRWDYAALIVIPILLIPLLLHLDPLRGALAFWKTLPISRQRLFTAKVATLLVFFVALPLACEVIYFVKAGLSAVLAKALADWAGRFLPGVAAVVLGCLFTRSLKIGVPCVAVLLWLTSQFSQWPYGPDRSAEPILGARARKPGIIAAPSGARMAIEPKSVSFSRTNYTAEAAPGKARRTEEQLAVTLKLEVAGLPEDVLVGAVGLHVDAIHLPGGVIEAGDTGGFYNPGIPEQEQRKEFGRRDLDYRQLGPNDWTVSTKFLPFATKDLAPAGALVEGTVRVLLVRRRLVKTLPLADSAQWQPGLHRFQLSEVPPPDARLVNYRGALTTILADPRGDTGGLALTPDTNFVVWVEHDSLPYRKYLHFISSAAWGGGDGNPIGRPRYSNAELRQVSTGSANPATIDITRSLRRTEFIAAFDPVGTLRTNATALTVARFAEEQAQVRNWHLAIVTYEDLGTVVLPLKAIAPRPQLARERDDGGDGLKPLPPSLSTMLEEVKIPAKPSRAEAEQIFARIAEFAAARAEDDIRRHENLLLKKLAALGADNVEVLLTAATQALRRVTRSELSPRSQREWLIGEASWQRSTPFWGRVLIVACDLARPADKAAFLRFHSPTVNLLRAIVPQGWSAEALPAMCAAAMDEPVPNEWQDLFARHPGPETGAALLAQIRQRAVPPLRVAEFIGLGALPARVAASTLWETAVANAGFIEELTPAFPLAVKHGVEIVPRDLLRLLRLSNDEMNRSHVLPFATLQSSFVQSFSLRSDCPPALSEAAPWLEENALLVQFDERTGRFELPNKVTPAPVLAGWGESIDPLGGGRVQVNGDSLDFTTAGFITDYWTDVSKRTSPRLMREVTGDFTAEVTVQPAFNLSKPWNNNRNSIFQSAGMLVDAGAPRTIRWEHALFQTADRHELRDETIRSGNSAISQRATAQWDPTKPVRLRLARHGDLFNTAWQQDGGAWVESPAQTNVGWPEKLHVGLLMVNNCTRPLSARFTDFKIEPASTAPLVLATPLARHPAGEPTPDGTRLDEWGTVENPIGAGVFKPEGKTLSVLVAPKDSDYNNVSARTAPHALSDIEGDFTLEATIAPTPRKKWSSADLLITAGVDFYLRVGIGSNGTLLFHNLYAENGWSTNLSNLDAKPDLTKPLRIRFQRRGWFLTIAYRPEGGDWVEFYPLNLRAWPAKIRAGIVALNTTDEPFTAIFSDFVLTSDTPR